MRLAAGILAFGACLNAYVGTWSTIEGLSLSSLLCTRLSLWSSRLTRLSLGRPDLRLSSSYESESLGVLYLNAFSCCLPPGVFPFYICCCC